MGITLPERTVIGWLVGLNDVIGHIVTQNDYLPKTRGCHDAPSFF
jgi:hypothetical protein